MDQATRARDRAVDFIKEIEVEYADWDETIADPVKRYELVHRIAPVVNALVEQLPLCGLPGDATRLERIFDRLCQITIRRLKLNNAFPFALSPSEDPIAELEDCKAEADDVATDTGQKFRRHLADIERSLRRGEKEVWPEINEEASRVTINGVPIDLTPEGCRMVKLLADARDWVAMDKNGFSKPSDVKRNLPTAILRHIESVSGKGYRWNPEP